VSGAFINKQQPAISPGANNQKRTTAGKDIMQTSRKAIQPPCNGAAQRSVYQAVIPRTVFVALSLPGQLIPANDDQACQEQEKDQFSQGAGPFFVCLIQASVRARTTTTPLNVGLTTDVNIHVI
jgi:hypothetical protein